MGWEPEVRRKKAKGRRPWYTLEVGGKRHHLGTDTGKAYDRAADLISAAGVEPGEPSTISGLYAAYLRHVAPKRPQGCVRFFEWSSNDETGTSKRLVELEPADLQRFADWLAKQQTKTKEVKPPGEGEQPKIPKPPHRLSKKSVRHYVSHARQMWAWGASKGWAICDPGQAKTARPIPVPRDMAVPVLKKSLAKLNPRAQAIVTFIASEGCRPSEARRLKWEQVDFENSTIVLGGGAHEPEQQEHKTEHHGKTRTIYITPKIEKLLQDQPRHNEFVFNTRYKRPWTKDGLRTVLQRAGIRSSYSLRHTFAQWFLDHGGPGGKPGSKEELQAWLGHSDPRTTDIYAQVRDRRLQNVAKRIKGPLGA